MQTYTIQHALIEAGYKVALKQFGECNIVIISIQQQGMEQIPVGTNGFYTRDGRTCQALLSNCRIRNFLQKLPMTSE